MNSILFSCSSLPLDIILKIGSSLQVIDLCALSSCSRFWRELCGSDVLWEPLFRKRWPLLCTFDSDSSTQFPQPQNAGTTNDENSQEWRRYYVVQHKEMASRASQVITYVTKWPATLSLEGGEYLHAVETMSSMRLGFQDVELFIFKPNLSVLLNLIGLIYCTPKTAAGANLGCAKAKWNLRAASLGEMVDVRSMVRWETNERRNRITSGLSSRCCNRERRNRSTSASTRSCS